MSVVEVAVNIKRFRSPKTVISRFVARRTMKSAAFWALAFGAIVASKSAGYAAAYPTIASRTRLLASFTNNIGLNAIFGVPHGIQTIGGFTTWNVLASMMIIGSIWAFLLATKTLRGEESAERWELLLSGQTTGGRAAANALVGLGASLVVLFGVSAIVFAAVGRIHSVDFSTQAAAFLALAGISSAVMFMSVGALASQLMPTRSRAAGLSAGFFGICFLIRAMADTTNAHWLLNFTPLGWVERLRPLYASQPLWLLPIAGLTIIFCTFTIVLAGRRDLNASTFVDKDSAKPHVKLLNTPLQAAIRLNRAKSLSWILAIGFFSVFFGLLTKSAALAVNQSHSFQYELSKVLHAGLTASATTYLGLIFFLLMPLVMSYAASAVGGIREDEAEEYVDNFLVRSVSRLRWLWGRISLVIVVIVLAGLVAGIGAWVGAASQHAGVTFHSLLLAGINIMAPALFILGVGIFIMGVLPRLTTVIAYGVIAWSFLLQILSSGLHLSHWITDTSVLTHVNLAPAVNPNWESASILVGAALVLCVVGSLVFNSRDLQAE